MRSVFVAICVLVVALGGCSKPESPQPAADDTKRPEPQSIQAASAASAPIDACSLLTSEEIQAVQGEPLQEPKPSQHSGAGMTHYDCLFTLPTFTNSISLSVAQRGTGGEARDPRKAWQETLAAAHAKASEKSPPPRMIEALGDEAFWAGDDRIGALYVLKGSRYLRISVGGAGDREAKINRSRLLAEAALKRM